MQINSYILKPGAEPLLTPVIVSISDKTNNTGSFRSFFATITAASTTSYTYTWSATGLPPGVSIRASDGRIRGTIDANLNTKTYNVVVTVSVTNGSQTRTDTEAFNWQVNKVIQGPTNTRILRSGGSPNTGETSWCGFTTIPGSNPPAPWEFTISRTNDFSCTRFNEGEAAQVSGDVPLRWTFDKSGWQTTGKWLEIGKNCKSIGNFAFKNMSPTRFHFRDQPNFPGLQIPESVTYIGQEAFKNKYNICEYQDNILRMPSSVEKIDKNAFNGCANIEAIIFKNSSKLREISDDAFNGISDLDYNKCPVIRIPASVRTMSTLGIGGFFRSNVDICFAGPVTSPGKHFQRPTTSVPFRNCYINAPVGGFTATSGFSGFFSTASNIYISPQYFNEWNNFKNHPGRNGSFTYSQFASWFGTPIQVYPRPWSSFPDAMDGAWAASDFD